MTLNLINGAAGQLRSHLAASLGGDPAWDLALSRLARGETSLHLAVLTEPFCSWLLEGTKTIESRFSRVRCAPYGTLAEGDIVAVGHRRLPGRDRPQLPAHPRPHHRAARPVRGTALRQR
jgi:hypothetical protein